MAAVSTAMQLSTGAGATAGQMKRLPLAGAAVRASSSKKGLGLVGLGSPKSSRSFEVRASLKEKAVTGLTAAALTASMVMPQVAEAAESSGVSPSLKNFLLSIVAGGVVLGVIFGAVIGVANFDPVKRS